MNDEIMTLDKMLSEASKTVPTARSMDIYINMLREAITSSVAAMESNQEATAAMYIGQADMAMKHIDAIWNIIMQRNG
jgi:uncharacterized ferredoxin-like protein